MFSFILKNHIKHIEKVGVPTYRLGLVALLLLTSLFSLSPRPRDLKSGTNRKVENQLMTNWSGHDYAPRISPDGRYLIFQSDRPGPFEDQNLWFSENLAHPDITGRAEWSVPQPLFFPLSGRASKTMKVFRPSGTQIDPDGSFSINTDTFEGMANFVFRKMEPVEIYFTSIKSKVGHREGYDGLNIYFSRYRDGRWSAASHLNIINSQFDDRMPVVSDDGTKMYFVSNRPGGYGGSDIWYSERDLNTGLWSMPVNAGPHFNTTYDEISPSFISRDQILTFSSDRPGGLGHFDIYMSRYNGMSWEKVKNLGEPFNSKRDDEYLSMTKNGLWTYLTSDRLNSEGRGGYDIYRLRTPSWLVSLERISFIGNIIDGATRLPLGMEATVKILYAKQSIVEVSKVQRKVDDSVESNNFFIKLQANREYRMIVSAPGYHPREIRLSYIGSASTNGVDKRDIVLQPIIEKNTDSSFKYKSIVGRVINKATGSPVSNVHVGMTTSYNKEPMSLRVSNDGRFLIRVLPKKIFYLNAKALGFEDFKKTFTVRPDLKQVILRMKRKGSQDPCKYLEIACIERTFVLFATNSSKIRKIEYEKLKKVALILKKNPSQKILIAGHTDHRFTKEYNLRLSRDRARSVEKYLRTLGVAKARLSVTGYGYFKPIVSSEKTELDRQKNRRVEFRFTDGQ